MLIVDNIPVIRLNEEIPKIIKTSSLKKRKSYNKLEFFIVRFGFLSLFRIRSIKKNVKIL